MNKTVVFVLSTNYAGSHYLSLMLGSHSHTAHVGEVHRLANRGNKRPICYSCATLEACPVLGGIGPEQANDIYDIVFSRMPAEKAVLIDCSKAIEWVERFSHSNSFERKYVHLIRDPRAFVRRGLMNKRLGKHYFDYRWKLMREFPNRALHFPLAGNEVVLAYQWLEQNRQITRLIDRHKLDARVVTYRDLARDPAGELGRLMEWMGLPFEPSQLEYWTVEHHGSQKPEYEWVKESKTTRHFDLRWKTELSSAIQQQIITQPDVAGYLQGLGLRVTDEGLTRLS